MFFSSDQVAMFPTYTQIRTEESRTKLILSTFEAIKINFKTFYKSWWYYAEVCMLQ